MPANVITTVTATIDTTTDTTTSRRPGGPDMLAWVPDGRRLVLIDIENIVGGSDASESDVAAAMAALHSVVRPTPHDVVVAACGRRLLKTAMRALGTSISLGCGIDGADRRLIEHMDPQHVGGRYASVVLASGDAAAFAAPVTCLAALGIPTDLVIGAGKVGADLYKTARSMTSLPSRPAALTTDSFSIAA